MPYSIMSDDNQKTAVLKVLWRLLLMPNSQDADQIDIANGRHRCALTRSLLLFTTESGYLNVVVVARPEATWLWDQTVWCFSLLCSQQWNIWNLPRSWNTIQSKNDIPNHEFYNGLFEIQTSFWPIKSTRRNFEETEQIFYFHNKQLKKSCCA